MTIYKDLVKEQFYQWAFFCLSRVSGSGYNLQCMRTTISLKQFMKHLPRFYCLCSSYISFYLLYPRVLWRFGTVSEIDGHFLSSVFWVGMSFYVHKFIPQPPGDPVPSAVRGCKVSCAHSTRPQATFSLLASRWIQLCDRSCIKQFLFYGWVSQFKGTFTRSNKTKQNKSQNNYQKKAVYQSLV